VRSPRKCPCPRRRRHQQQRPTTPTTTTAAAAVVSAAQLQRMGELLLRLLFELKHCGAVEKAAIGLSALTARLLRCAGLIFTGTC
jgi:hypothetical protein